MENLLSFKKLFIAAICSLFALTLTAQVSYSPGGCDGAAPYGGPNINPSAVKESKNGWVLPVNGTINVLVIFAEINYDVTADPYGAPSANWQQGQLPVFKNQLYDPVISTNPTGIITKYFKEASFGNYNVIGDYIIDPLNPNVCITVNQSDFAAQGGQFGALFTKINSFANFQTANNVTITDFDNWTLTSDGEPKIFPSVDLPNKYDHVCVVWRNSTSPINQNGYTGQGSLGNIFGLVMDSYQVVTGHDNIPYNIMKHEYGHLMVGGNNFHIDGGGQNNYFLPRVEVGWGVMTAANGSLQTCSSWDRDRFDWKGPGKTMTISCRNAANTAEVIGDLDATNATQAGTYILRDFQTTGDAVRIKLPNTPAGKYEQWLWIENHNGFAMNGSVFDKFMYQDNPCRQTALYGLYAYIQIDKNVKSGPNTYGGNGNFKRTVCADGNFDYTFDGSQILNTCIAYGMAQPFQKYVPNPLSGDQDQQIIHHDKNNDLSLFGDAYSPFLETKILAFFDNLAMHGLSRHAFTYQGNKKIGIGSNPSPASKMNLSNSSTLELSDVKNLRSIYLNGISVEIINQAANGEITVLVRFDDIDVNNNVSWCGDDIVLSPPHVSTAGGLALNVKAGKIITLDQSTTPSRYTTPINYNGQNVFADPTVFRIKTGAIAQLEANSKIIVQNGSTLLLEPGGQIDMLANTEIRVKTGSKLIMDQYSYINNYGGKIIIEDGATLEYTNGLVNLFNSTSTLEIAGLLDLKTPLSGNNVFKIGGDGYIKFNSPNTSGNNINCGNDCYIEFGNSNNSTTQKVVELLQSKLIIPTNLMGLSFMHGKYFFQGGSYIQSSGINTGVLFNYATITSTSVGYNGHSGIRLSGQPTNASYSNFYNGAYGIYNVQTAGGNSISLTNCVFNNCGTGLYTYDKGASITNCNFDGNRGFGWWAQKMSLLCIVQNSSFSNITYSTANGKGVRFDGTASGTLLTWNSYYNNNRTGIEIQNAVLAGYCNQISNNVDRGINLLGGATLDFAGVVSTGYMPMNDISNNPISVGTSVAKNILLSDGYNNLQPNAGGLSISGTIKMFCTPPPSIVANYNNWDGTTLPPSNYNLTTVAGQAGCTSAIPVTISDSNPGPVIACGSNSQMMAGTSPINNCPTCDNIYTPHFSGQGLEEASVEALEKTTQVGGNDFKEAVNMYNEILMYNLPNPDAAEKYVLNHSYNNMLPALGRSFRSGQITEAQNATALTPEVQKTIDVQNKLIVEAAANNAYLDKYYLTLDKAQTYRLAGRRDLAFVVLDDLATWVQPEQTDYFNYWSCTTHMEQDLIDGTISYDDFVATIDNCGTSANYRFAQTATTQNTNSSIANMAKLVSVYPNPVKDNLTIENLTGTQIKIELTNTIGQVLYSNKFSEANFNLNCAAFTKGIYSLAVSDVSGFKFSVKKVVVN